MNNYCECGKTYKSENFPCVCDDCERGENTGKKVMNYQVKYVELLRKYVEVLKTNKESIRKETRVFEILLDDTITDEGKVAMIGFVLSN